MSVEYGRKDYRDAISSKILDFWRDFFCWSNDDEITGGYDILVHLAYS